MNYYRKVSCQSLNLNLIFESQAYALRVFTKLYDSGLANEVTLEDYKVDESVAVTLDDPNFDQIWNSIISQYP